MKVFNLRKTAALDAQITDKSLEENREKMNLSNEQQGIVDKNINTGISKKNIDNTIPFNVQLNAARKNENEGSIIETKMDSKTVVFGKQKDEMMPINEVSADLSKKKDDDYKKSSNKDKKDTAFWDKYVDLSTGGNEKTTIINNIPPSASQLWNKSAISEEVSNLLKDADAMLFHIYTTIANEKSELNKIEKQQIIDINSGKTRLISQIVAQPSKRSLEQNPDPIIKKDPNGAAIVYEGNKPIDEFKSCEEAHANYPEGEIINE